VGLAAERVGRTSITYRLAVFGAAPEAAAVCRYVHVYVDAATRRPVPLPETLRRAAEALAV
jgi:acyl-CoA thioester hydrolase